MALLELLFGYSIYLVFKACRSEQIHISLTYCLNIHTDQHGIFWFLDAGSEFNAYDPLRIQYKMELDRDTIFP